MAPKKRSPSELLQAAKAAGTAIQEQDRVAEVRATMVKVTSLPLEKITKRAIDTRELKSKHVEGLSTSIAVLGLLEPLVVDRRGRLLAGGHRLEAISSLKTEQPEVYAEKFPENQVPIRSLDFDADEEPDLALQVEVAENEQRRDYTASEVRSLADRLKAEGYADSKGRPAKGQKALRPALEIIIGKSLRTVRRYLNEPEEEVVEVGLEEKALTGLQGSLDRWQKAYGGVESEVLQEVDREVEKLQKRLMTITKKLLKA